jgi:protease I
MTEPRKSLQQAGAQVTLAALKSGQVQRMNHDGIADTFSVDAGLDQVSPADFDALMLPGGALNAVSPRVWPKAQELARHMDREGKPMAIICHASCYLSRRAWHALAG